ncbi:MAG TPA: TetR/AcrR family transcriptional regulator [Geobacteraceae bacterium]|nr:TetR/AcrR family transcriptional regulator [Geobacteraceae bacterium]
MAEAVNTIRLPEQGLIVKERLLSAALELFTVKGYAATTVREIVAAAGVSKPALYYYFSNKEGIYLALMDSTYDVFKELISLLTASGGSTRERIIHFCTGMFDGFLVHMDVARIIYSIYFGPPQGAPPFPYEKFFDEMLEIVRGMIRDGIHNRELQKVDESDAAWAIMSGLNSVMEEQLCRNCPRIDREGLVRMISLIFNGISRSERKKST